MNKRWIAGVAILGTLLGIAAAAPAQAAPEPSWPAGVATPKAQKWNPDPKVPELTLPGGGTMKAFSNLRSSGPTALPGYEKAPANTLAAEDPYYCSTLMSRTNSVREEMPIPAGPGDLPLQFAQVLYLGQVNCNVWMDYMTGVAGLIDRTPGYNGRTLSTGQPFTYTDWHQGTSTGGIEIPGDATDGARQAEVAFDLILVAPAPLKWGNCAPGPGQRILLCTGVGTSTLHVQLGLGVFDTGLRPPVARYVALGDSYASGTGVGNYSVPGPPACRRSYLSYPYQIGGLRIPNGTVINPVSHACHGALIQDMYTTQPNAYPESNQLSYLNPQTTRMVSVSIGGNDLGFATKLRQCVFDVGCGVGGGELVTAADTRRVQGQLSTLYTEILRRIRPDGILIVLNYPAIFPPLGQAWSWCGAQGTVGPDEVGQIQQAWVAGRLMVANAVTAVGNPRVRLVDMYDGFAGHYVCSPDPWANGIVPGDSEDSFHPTSAGHQAYRNRIVQSLGLR